MSSCLLSVLLISLAALDAHVALAQSMGTASGRVTALKTGSGIPNAAVVCSGPSQGVATTNSSGHYAISGLAPGPYSFKVSAPGYVNKSAISFIDAADNPLPPFLLNMLSLRGRVYDASMPSAGISEANITIGENFVLANSSGHYEWLDLSDGAYTVTVSAPGFSSQTRIVSVAKGTTTAEDFGLNSVSPGRISGKVTDSATRQGLYQANVRVSRGSLQKLGTTDQSGQYAIENVPAWPSWTVEAYKVGYEAQSTTASIQSDMTTSLNFALVPFGRINGTVKDQTTNQPINGALVKAGSAFQNITDSSGYYSIFVLADTYVVTAAAPGYASQSVYNVKVTEGDTKTVSFLLQSVPPGAIVGNVADATTNNAISGALVTADGHSNITDNNGDYVLSDMPAWTYEVNVSAPGFLGDSAQRNVPSGGSVIADFLLSPFTRLHFEPYLNFGDLSQSFSLDLEISEARFVYNWTAHLWWDPQLFDAASVTEGSFLKGPFGNRTTQLTNTTYTNEGVMYLKGWSTVTPPDGGVSGSGKLASIVFKIKAKGMCRIQLTNALLFDAYGFPIFANGLDGAFFRTLQGDINNDGVVDVLDVGAASIAYGSASGDIEWNVYADVNRDRLIDTRDLYRVGKDYGQST